MLFYKLNVLSVLLYCFYTVNCLVDPLSLGLLGATISTLYLWLSSEDRSNFGCKLFKYVGQKIGYCEGCEDYWITDNLKDLEYEMKSSVYGQPLAVDIIMSAMRNHLRRDVEPDRALMLSFHGSPGTGKNFIAQMILKNMFRMGAKSEYTIFFRSSIDFPLKSKIDEYKRDIVQRIKDKVYECHRSIFVFDEVEKMPDGLLEVLSGVVTIGVHREYDFRKSIFILLSNIGSDILVSETLKEVRLSGNRENMEAARLHRLLAAVSFNSEGGFKKSGLVKRFGISHYVPFLPLESDHVIQCLVREVVGLGQVISNELIKFSMLCGTTSSKLAFHDRLKAFRHLSISSQVLEEITFKPDDNPIFSAGGCKGIKEAAVVLIERELKRKRRSQKY